MFGSRAHAIVTLAMLLEVGIAGWMLGYGTLWLLGGCLAVTVADTLWGVTRRRMPADLVGLEVAATLAIALHAGADPALTCLLAAACIAWLIRPERQPAQVCAPEGDA